MSGNTENKFGMTSYAPAFAAATEEATQSTRLICQHCGRDYKDKSSLRVHNFKKHRHLSATATPSLATNGGNSAAAALVATSVQMAHEESDAYQEQQRIQILHHQLRLQQLQARAATADLAARPHDFHHDDDFYGHHDDDNAFVDHSAAAAAAFSNRQRQQQHHSAFLQQQQESHKRGAAQQSSFAALAPASAAHMSIDVTTRLLPVLNPAVDETGKRRRVGERFTPTPIGSITKRSKAAFLPVSPHTAASSTGQMPTAVTDNIAGNHTDAAPSAPEHFELDASEIAKNLSMLNDLADVALATSRNPQ